MEDLDEITEGLLNSLADDAKTQATALELLLFRPGSRVGRAVCKVIIEALANWACLIALTFGLGVGGVLGFACPTALRVHVPQKLVLFLAPKYRGYIDPYGWICSKSEKGSRDEILGLDDYHRVHVNCFTVALYSGIPTCYQEPGKHS